MGRNGQIEITYYLANMNLGDETYFFRLVLCFFIEIKQQNAFEEVFWFMWQIVVLRGAT